ncbi:hypothetical protein BS78_04G055500 [Paspalum vaginatum]|nr:hypothetical protein BS78_04G055500 [Paspalum vaginatum]
MTASTNSGILHDTQQPPPKHMAQGRFNRTTERGLIGRQRMPPIARRPPGRPGASAPEFYCSTRLLVLHNFFYNWLKYCLLLWLLYG